MNYNNYIQITNVWRFYCILLLAHFTYKFVRLFLHELFLRAGTLRSAVKLICIVPAGLKTSPALFQLFQSVCVYTMSTLPRLKCLKSVLSLSEAHFWASFRRRKIMSPLDFIHLNLYSQQERGVQLK